MKYINVEKLKDKIENITFIPQTSADYNDGRNDMKMMFLDIIDSFKQEQPKVDLEKEIKRFTMSKELYEADSAIKAVAEHFFELGLKAKDI